MEKVKCCSTYHCYSKQVCLKVVAHICAGRRGRDHMEAEFTINYASSTYHPLSLWARIPLRLGVLDTTLCDEVCQCLAVGRWFSPCTPVSSTNKTERHDITEILFKVALNTIIITPNPDGTGNEAVSPNKDQTDEEI